MTTSAFSAPYAVYTGRATNWPMVLISSALVIPLLTLGNAQGNWTLPLLIAGTSILLNVLTASSIRTTAGPNGVSVHFGVIGWPRRTYRPARIQAAEVIDLSPWQVAHGFWWTPTRTCCTVRSGPTLRLTLTTGRTVTITVPDPHAAVAAITTAGRP